MCYYCYLNSNIRALLLLMCYYCYLNSNMTALLLLMCYYCYLNSNITALLLLMCYYCYLNSNITALLLLMCYYCYLNSNVTALLLLPISLIGNLQRLCHSRQSLLVSYYNSAGVTTPVVVICQNVLWNTWQIWELTTAIYNSCYSNIHESRHSVTRCYAVEFVTQPITSLLPKLKFGS